MSFSKPSTMSGNMDLLTVVLGQRPDTIHKQISSRFPLETKFCAHFNDGKLGSKESSHTAKQTSTIEPQKDEGRRA